MGEGNGKGRGSSATDASNSGYGNANGPKKNVNGTRKVGLGSLAQLLGVFSNTDDLMILTTDIAIGGEIVASLRCLPEEAPKTHSEAASPLQRLLSEETFQLSQAN